LQDAQEAHSSPPAGDLASTAALVAIATRACSAAASAASAGYIASTIAAKRSRGNSLTRRELHGLPPTNRRELLREVRRTVYWPPKVRDFVA
jgi:hypothetical protein